MFMMSLFRILKGVREKLDYYRSRFFWQCDEHKKKYRLAKWSTLHKPKCIGGGHFRCGYAEQVLAKQVDF
jgi:hypothetical protein